MRRPRAFLIALLGFTSFACALRLPAQVAADASLEALFDGDRWFELRDAIQLTVNDRPLDWLLDTGAGITVMSDGEARRLGIATQESSGKTADMAGGVIGVQTALIPRMAIGQTELRHVPAVILPDTRPPFNERPPGEHDILSQAAEVTIDFTSMSITLR